MSRAKRTVDLFNKARVAAGNALSKASPAQVAAVSKRLGSKITDPRALADMVKKNPFTSALVLAEIYGVGHPLVRDLIESNPEIANALDGVYVDDKVGETTSVSDISSFHDEFAAIATAIRVVGSMEKLVQLRRAIKMDEEVFVLYGQVKSLSRNMI